VWQKVTAEVGNWEIFWTNYDWREKGKRIYFESQWRRCAMTNEELKIMDEALKRHTAKVTKSKAAALAFLKRIGGLPEQIEAARKRSDREAEKLLAKYRAKGSKSARSKKKILAKAK
jgi:hypothetical protein